MCEPDRLGVRVGGGVIDLVDVDVDSSEPDMVIVAVAGDVRLIVRVSANVKV